MEVSHNNFVIEQINPLDGSVIVVSALDFETEDNYIVTVEVTSGRESNRTSASATLNISVNDVNDHHPVFTQPIVYM